MAMVVAGCASSSSPRNSGGTTTVEFWVGWQDREFQSLQKVIAGFEQTHPTIKVHLVPNQSDPTKVTLAVQSGNGPDLATAWGTDQLGKLCASGVLSDLSSYEQRDHVVAAQFPRAAQAAFAYQGRHCALPYLADTLGLYYNKDLLAAAGYSGPPRSTSQMIAMAKRLTEYNRDGSIKVAGFVPIMGFAQSYMVNYSGWFGTPYFDANGKADTARDPRWTALFTFLKQIVDAEGYAKLSKFVATAGPDGSNSDEFDNGKVAMLLDGEWRTAGIDRDFPKLNYGTAGLPAPTDDPVQAGASNISVTLLGIPKNAKHRDAAWVLARYLAVQTPALVQFASAIHNVPTTVAALQSSSLSLGTHFAPFLAAAANPHSSFPPILASGPVYEDPIETFAEQWMAGKISNLHAGLVNLDSTIDKLVAQG
jgi:multiple sugar transport system substrate-binding protein